MLFNLFAGETMTALTAYSAATGARVHWLRRSSLSDNFFVANRPSIEHVDEQLFKYHVDFDSLTVSPQARRNLRLPANQSDRQRTQ